VGIFVALLVPSLLSPEESELSQLGGCGLPIWCNNLL
jgi:hypothetical protein